MEILENIALRVRLPSELTQTITRYVERSEVVDGDLLMCWDYDEAAYLAQTLDHKQPSPHLPSVPSPMLRDYKWPGIYKPFAHQSDTASFLSLRSRAFVFNEAGTGKTSAAIWAADYLMNIGKVKRVLVVCPMSIMYTAWQQDIFNTAMHRTAAVAYGSAQKRRKILEGGYEFIITNYDGTKVLYDDLRNGGFDLIIVDEANSYKNTGSKRWKILAKLMTPSTRLWMMTGTPASQSPVDAFGLARLIAPHRVPKYASAWRDRVLLRVSQFRYIPKPSAKNDVFYALQPAIRYTKAECLDLPEVVYQTRFVPITPQVAQYYKRLKTQMMVEAAGERISAVNAAASLTKLLQLSGGAMYTDNRNVVEFDIAPRLNTLSEVLDETLNKVLVFVPYGHTITVVSEYLTKSGVSNEIIDGGVSASRRADIINRFQQQSEPRVLVIQPQAASHGVTLTAADTIVFWSPVMSVETYLQCIARIDRVGQQNRMTVVHLEGSEVEEKVYKMLRSKVDSHQKLVELYEQIFS